MGWKHTVYHIINSDPGHMRSKSSNCTNTEKNFWQSVQNPDNHYERKKMAQLQKCTFLEEVPKIKRYTFPLITTFYNFTLKIETSWARKVVKFVFETWNINEIIVCVWFVKKSKICNAKKNNFKCRKFSIKLK